MFDEFDEDEPQIDRVKLSVSWPRLCSVVLLGTFAPWLFSTFFALVFIFLANGEHAYKIWMRNALGGPAIALPGIAAVVSVAFFKWRGGFPASQWWLAGFTFSCINTLSAFLGGEIAGGDDLGLVVFLWLLYSLYPLWSFVFGSYAWRKVFTAKVS